MVAKGQVAIEREGRVTTNIDSTYSIHVYVYLVGSYGLAVYFHDQQLKIGQYFLLT